MLNRLKLFNILFFVTVIFIINGCASKTVANNTSIREGYNIQVGAFKNMENAGRLVDKLNTQGVDAFLYKDGGYYKVRFGNYSSLQTARKRGNALKNKGIIDTFFIVTPESYSYSQKQSKGENYVRNQIAKTASTYMGVPYAWGGNNKSGIDCSGLTKAVYRLNGISLPRVSRDQYSRGKFIKKSQLKKGDLVFFATGRNKKRVSHVGIYMGNNKFIHAPSKGKKVRVESLNNKYWKKTYIGARTYL